MTRRGDTQRFYLAVILIVAAMLCMVCRLASGAAYRTPNFIVQTATPQLAEQLGKAAEQYRRQLAVEWLGHEMPDWSQPCVMTARAGPNLGPGGHTTFFFGRGSVFGWQTTIQGSVQRLFDSVLPHEITHMVFASHFRRPVPRWADEGGATSVEHADVLAKHRRMLVQFLKTNRGIAFNRMLAMTTYPRDVMPLYAQGYSLADFLIQQGGRQKYVAFLGDGMKTGNWSEAIRCHYGAPDTGVLQETWLAWVRQGSPRFEPFGGRVRDLFANCRRGGSQPAPSSECPPGCETCPQRQPGPETWQPAPIQPRQPTPIAPQAPLEDVVLPEITIIVAGPEAYTPVEEVEGSDLQPTPGLRLELDGLRKELTSVRDTRESTIRETVRPLLSSASGAGAKEAIAALTPLVLSALGLGGATPAVLALWGLVRWLRKPRRAPLTPDATTPGPRPPGRLYAEPTTDPPPAPSPPPEPVVVHHATPPPPQTVRRDREFVSYETPNGRRTALEWAHDEYVRKFPGARAMIETIEAYADQYESGLAKQKDTQEA